MTRVFDLSHVRHDPTHCLAPGLFQSLKRGKRRLLKLDITYNYNGTSIRFWGPEPLGPDDLRVLQGVVAMAAVASDIGGGGALHLRPDTQSEEGKILRERLNLTGEAVKASTIIAKVRLNKLAREVGFSGDGGKLFIRIRGSLERLAAVTVVVRQDQQRQKVVGGFHIISAYEIREGGEIFVALNPMLARAVIGQRAAHTIISLSEVRRLKRGPTRILHQQLCARIDPGKGGRSFHIDRLWGYVWPQAQEDEIGGGLLSKRKAAVRKGLKELTEIGWEVYEYAKDKFHISRPKIGT